MPSSPTRSWTPYELNQLAKAHLTPLDVKDVGETPVEYITGQVTFAGLDFQVTPDVLIPRVESEELVGHLLKTTVELYHHQSPLVIADIGTGSGALGISLAHFLLKTPQLNFHLYLSDISPLALQVARQNVQRLLPSHFEVTTLLESDLLLHYPYHFQADLIVANLPYIPTDRLATLPESVRKYEPQLALDGGSDGLSLIQTLLSQAEKKLKRPGYLWLEIDETHSLDTILEQQPEWAGHLFLDQFGKKRFIKLWKK
jgi:release factor glutamine methyltransferase